ncbi:MAG: polysaccharide biosynthesis protein [Rhizobiales bacterium]|nr:polysaccharide biosynthesis protein [Hyphomicrobiales bacterium]
MTAVRTLASFLQGLPSQGKVAIIALADFLVLNLAVFLAYALRLSSPELPDRERIILYVVAPVLSVASAFPFGIYWSASRNYSSILEQRILTSQVIAAGGWITLVFFVGTPGFARSVVLIYLLLAVALMILLRKAAALIFGAGTNAVRQRPLVPALIYGASHEGQAVLEAMRRNRTYRPIAFVDTDYTLIGRTIAGLKVYSPEDLPVVMERRQPREVIVARSDLGRSSRRLLVDHLLAQGLTVKMAPPPGEFMDGELKLTELRAIKVEDLLGRDPVPPDRFLMEKVIKDQVVMVTGAGGSIGSELVRQAMVYQPRKLVLIDNSEFALFEIHRAIEAQPRSHEGTTCSAVPILADIRDKSRMSAIMREHGVDIVFHAAAYKHVRMVQENAAAGIDNNVFGTKAVAEAARDNKVKRFVMISTDKAVRPTSIMGASKRVAEMVVQALAAEMPGTIFAMVRFGNVLGSTGSVVPLFREQIAGGGPVNVTHPDVTRFFMLIPEAAQLVIQAAAMAEGGEVFVLDMGESVKIMQLAKSMIELAGLTVKNEENPDGDIEIRITGLKDGEKLYEELQIGTDIQPTHHPRIMRSREFSLPLHELDAQMRGIVPAPGDRPKADVVLKLAMAQ